MTTIYQTPFILKMKDSIFILINKDLCSASRALDMDILLRCARENPKYVVIALSQFMVVNVLILCFALIAKDSTMPEIEIARYTSLNKRQYLKLMMNISVLDMLKDS